MFDKNSEEKKGDDDDDEEEDDDDWDAFKSFAASKDIAAADIKTESASEGPQLVENSSSLGSDTGHDDDFNECTTLQDHNVSEKIRDEEHRKSEEEQRISEIITGEINTLPFY